VCKDTLSLLDITRFDFNEYLEKQLYAHALSKFRYEINADIINEQSDSVGVMVITSLGNQCTVRLKSDDNKDGFLDYVIFKNDALVFPSHLFIKQLSNDDDILIKIFKIGPIKQHGSGNNKFRLSLQLIDNYEIDIYANSEQEAIDFGYNIGLVHWEHIWGNPEPDSIPQTSRMSLWNKKMIKVKK
jgi:hypothetical protein